MNLIWNDFGKIFDFLCFEYNITFIWIYSMIQLKSIIISLITDIITLMQCNIFKLNQKKLNCNFILFIIIIIILYFCFISGEFFKIDLLPHAIVNRSQGGKSWNSKMTVFLYVLFIGLSSDLCIWHGNKIKQSEKIIFSIEL